MASPTQTWQSRRQDERIAVNADQAEFIAVRYKTSNLEAGMFDDRVAGSLDDYEVADPKLRDPPERWSWPRNDMAMDNAASDIGTEVRRRLKLLGNAYPFEIEGNRLVYHRSRSLVYEFCLAVSLSPSLSKGKFALLPVAFERLVRDALVCFLGPGAQGIRTGWPPDKHEHRPARFKDMIAHLNQMTGEWLWSPENELPNDPDPQDVKDEGLDFVVWKEVPDTRAGKLFLLGQCACGNDFTTKFSDIDANFMKLQRWVRPASYAWPVRVFTTPRHIPNDLQFKDINKLAGLTLDRTRITLMAETRSACSYIIKEAKYSYADLIRVVINGFGVARPTRVQPPQKVAEARRSRSRGTAV